MQQAPEPDLRDEAHPRPARLHFARRSGNIVGALVGQAIDVCAHPRGDFIWLSYVDLGDGGHPVQIVFGGDRLVAAGEYVPIAPPGARITVPCSDRTATTKKMRARNYRGQRSHGMLCSLEELGWLEGGPNEVAILRNLTLGQSLDDISPDKYAHVVVGWDLAQEFALELQELSIPA